MERTKKYQWHKIAESVAEIGFEGNGIKEVLVNNKKACIVLHNNNLSACAQKCPHAGGNLADGYVDVQGNIVCPLHRYKFSLQNGRNISGEGYYLKTWPVENREDGIYVATEINILF